MGVRPPTRTKLVGLILSQKGSAPGWDGIPYEVLAQGAHFVAEILHCAFEAAAHSSAALRETLGMAVDLLVWIPKAEGDISVAAQRPLQLPTCLRRLFGAALAEATGPAVEPLLSPMQAAKKGGSCGPNVRRLFRHLESGRGILPWAVVPGQQRAPHPALWDQLLGWAADPIRQWARFHC